MSGDSPPTQAAKDAACMGHLSPNTSHPTQQRLVWGTCACKFRVPDPMSPRRDMGSPVRVGLCARPLRILRRAIAAWSVWQVWLRGRVGASQPCPVAVRAGRAESCHRRGRRAGQAAPTLNLQHSNEYRPPLTSTTHCSQSLTNGRGAIPPSAGQAPVPGAVPCDNNSARYPLPRRAPHLPCAATHPRAVLASRCSSALQNSS